LHGVRSAYLTSPFFATPTYEKQYQPFYFWSDHTISHYHDVQQVSVQTKYLGHARGAIYYEKKVMHTELDIYSVYLNSDGQ